MWGDEENENDDINNIDDSTIDGNENDMKTQNFYNYTKAYYESLNSIQVNLLNSVNKINKENLSQHFFRFPSSSYSNNINELSDGSKRIEERLLSDLSKLKSEHSNDNNENETFI